MFTNEYYTVVPFSYGLGNKSLSLIFIHLQANLFSRSLTYAYHHLIKLILIAPLNIEKVITISVFYEGLSPTMHISNISGEILFEKN